MARFTTLYSGSSGNSAVLEENGRYLLVDIGKSCRKTTQALDSLGLAAEQLQGILITHEHIDHVGGLKVFLKKNHVPVYASPATLDMLAVQDRLPPAAQLCPVDGSVQEVGDFGVQGFATSHDAIDCHGYRITAPSGKTMALATDLGYLSETVHKALSGASLVALESNYDPFMLRTGPYPPALKVRIAGQRGHLSNDECAGKVLELIQEGCQKFCLCHLSHENNTPAHALGTVKNLLVSAGIRPGEDGIIQAAKREEISNWMDF